MSAVYTAAGLTAYSIYQGHEAGKDADAALALQGEAAAMQMEISQGQLDLSIEQWELYRDNIYPLELEAQQLGLDYQQISFQQYKDYYAPLGEEFATQAMEGVEAQPERAARDARLSVDQQFDTEEGMIQRNLERRGVRPGSGAYESGVTDTSLSRAAAKGFTVNRAVEAERDRVEDVNFNRMATALGRAPTVSGSTPGVTAGTSAYNMAAAGNTAQSAGSAYGNIAGTYGNAASGTVSGGIQLGAQAYDLYNQYSAPSSVPTYSNTPATNFQSPVTTNVDTGFNPVAFAEGGPVNVPAPAPALGRGNPDGGMVNGPPGVDQVPAYIEGQDGVQHPAKLTQDEFVIPADVVKVIGTGPLDDIIAKARNRKEQGQQSPNALTRRIN